MRQLLALLLAAAATLSADSVRVDLQVIAPELIQQRLESVKRDIRARRETLEALFRDAGCDALTTQPVRGLKEPNVICTLPSADPDARVIVVGAHYDLAGLGMGAVDDWSGASMLPSLYQSLAGRARRHSFQFVAFIGEEKGMLGSTEFVRKSDRKRTIAMINLDSLGLDAPVIWTSRADKRLAAAYASVAKRLGQQPAGINADRVGMDDSFPFTDAKIPVISFHSITQERLRILHSANDNLKAIDPAQHYAAYRLASLYLAYLDSALD